MCVCIIIIIIVMVSLIIEIFVQLVHMLARKMGVTYKEAFEKHAILSQVTTSTR